MDTVSFLGTLPILCTVAALGVAGLQTHRLSVAQADLVAARADLETCHGNVKTATDLVASQSAQTDAYRADGDKREAALLAALVPALKVAAGHQTKAAALAVYTPKGADACAQLVDLDREINP